MFPYSCKTPQYPLELTINIRKFSQSPITEKTPTWAFSWLKVPTSAFTFKILLRHYAKVSRRNIVTPICKTSIFSNVRLKL